MCESIIIRKFEDPFIGYLCKLKEILFTEDINHLGSIIQEKLENESENFRSIDIDLTDIPPDRLTKAERLFGMCEFFNKQLLELGKDITINLIINLDYKQYFPDLCDTYSFQIKVIDPHHHPSQQETIEYPFLIKSAFPIIVLLIILAFCTLFSGIFLLAGSLEGLAISFGSGILLYESIIVFRLLRKYRALL